MRIYLETHSGERPWENNYKSRVRQNIRLPHPMALEQRHKENWSKWTETQLPLPRYLCNMLRAKGVYKDELTAKEISVRLFLLGEQVGVPRKITEEKQLCFLQALKILLNKHLHIAQWCGVTVIQGTWQTARRYPKCLSVNHQIFTITLWGCYYSYFHFNGKENWGGGVLTWGLWSWESQQCQQQLGHQLRPSQSTLNVSNIQATRCQPLSCLLGKVQHGCCYFWAFLGKGSLCFLVASNPCFLLPAGPSLTFAHTLPPHCTGPLDSAPSYIPPLSTAHQVPSGPLNGWKFTLLGEGETPKTKHTLNCILGHIQAAGFPSSQACHLTAQPPPSVSASSPGLHSSHDTSGLLFPLQIP